MILNINILNLNILNKAIQEVISIQTRYQRGPRGGATSKAVKPLMHCATSPSPTLRIKMTSRMNVARFQTFWIQMRKNKPLNESRKTSQTSGTKMTYFTLLTFKTYRWTC
ncbi:hypothetical protein Hanom_Chr03g00231411 [Helianthus anomalus]